MTGPEVKEFFRRWWRATDQGTWVPDAYPHWDGECWRMRELAPGRRVWVATDVYTFREEPRS